MLERLEDVSLTICILSVVLAKCVDCMPPSMQIGLGRNELIRLNFSDGYSYKSMHSRIFVCCAQHFTVNKTFKEDFG